LQGIIDGRGKQIFNYTHKKRKQYRPEHKFFCVKNYLKKYVNKVKKKVHTSTDIGSWMMAARAFYHNED